MNKRYYKSSKEWLNSYEIYDEKEIRRFAIIEEQLAKDWPQTGYKSLEHLPKWVNELHKYDLRKKKNKISLSGTINPNPNKYRMVEMKYKLTGMAELEEYVEVEGIEAVDENEAASLATKELLQTHPEYVEVTWSTVDAH